MSVEKTFDKLLRGDSDGNIRFEELCRLLQAKGFRMRVSGSHHIFTQSGVM
jgi:Ca2+-binding EF-hand superfamily protein